MIAASDLVIVFTGSIIPLSPISSSCDRRSREHAARAARSPGADFAGDDVATRIDAGLQIESRSGVAFNQRARRIARASSESQGPSLQLNQ